MTPQDLLAQHYVQLCSDWRMRDGYMQSKLTGSAFVFSVFGWVATGLFGSDVTVPAPIPVLIFLGAAAYAFIVFLSVAKDAYYREGTETAMKETLQELVTLPGPVPPAISKLLLEPDHPRSLRPQEPPRGLALRAAGRIRTTVAIRVFYLLVCCSFLALAVYFAVRSPCPTP